MNKLTLEAAAGVYSGTAHDAKPHPIHIERNKAFKAGAQWQRNKVWHDMKQEEPQAYGEYEDKIYPQIPCLVRGQLSTGYGYGVRYWNATEKVWDDEECDDFECKKDDIEEWTYLDDLIPTSFDEILDENKDV